MSNAIFIQGDVKTINQKDINILKEKAYNSDNGRYRYCLHENISDSVQNMVIAITSSSKLLPQRRAGTNKVFTILEGEIAILVFDNDGSVINNLLLSEKSNHIISLSGDFTLRFGELYLLLSVIKIFIRILIRHWNRSLRRA